MKSMRVLTVLGPDPERYVAAAAVLPKLLTAASE